MEVRPEAEIFAELGYLCRSPGFIHAIAYFSYRDNVIRFGDQLDAESMESQYAAERLVRTEISTLIGLMNRFNIDATLPTPEHFQKYIDRTQALLEELHLVMTTPWYHHIENANGMATVSNSMWNGASMREPIFYSGESAYGFQYRALAIRKYEADNPWLLENKGFEIEDAVSVAEILATILTERTLARHKTMSALPPEEWTILPGYIFSIDDVQAHCAIDPARIEAVLLAFTLPRGDHNSCFTALHEFNATNATPLLHWGDNDFLLLQHYSLLESIYESPIFWMRADKEYANKANDHLGAFTESFAAECLEKVFGAARVFRNIDIYGPDRNRAGEIDVLAVYGCRAIVVQAKSKRLTIEARKGNDLQLKNDFKKAVQDAADQAFLCATALLDPSYKLKNADGATIELPRSFDVIQPLCIVSDHYPALALQVREFLHQQTTDCIVAPLVTDVFALDVMTEMLASPLHFLHYLALRTRFDDQLFASNELTFLGYHLTKNLWFDDEYITVMLSDDLSVHLDIAMLARREGVPGQQTPEGILTRLKDTTFGDLMRQIGDSNDPDVCELGLLLLQLDEKTARSLSSGIDTLADAAKRDQRSHDLSLEFDHMRSGLTIHCRYLDTVDTMTKLLGHCKWRKYASKSDSWYGLLVDPDTRSIMACIGSREPWAFDPQMEELLKLLPMRPKVPWSAVKQQVCRRVGRNDPCPCGSGRKYKKCCLNEKSH